MSGLPNLQKLIERRRAWNPDPQAAWTVVDEYGGYRALHAGTYPGTPDPRPSAAEQDARLAAAAPALAELLIECEEALDIAHGILDEEGYFVDPDFPHAQKIDHVLARLADFDGRIG